MSVTVDAELGSEIGLPPVQVEGGMASSRREEARRSALAASLERLGVPAEAVLDPLRTGQLDQGTGELLDRVVVGRAAGTL